MAESDRRHSGDRVDRGSSAYNSRKRRYREDDEQHERGRYGPRRRFNDAPPHVRVRRQLLAIAENPMQPWHEEAQAIATLLTDNWDDELLRTNFVDLCLQLALEQPLKTPFVAATVLCTNTTKPELVDTLLERAVKRIEKGAGAGDWRDVKLLLKLLACLQSCLEGDGVFPVLDVLFNRAVDLQTASSDDTIGTEIVKIVLLTIPYIMATGPSQWQLKAVELMDKTDIIASEPHALQVLIDPYHLDGEEKSPSASTSVVGLLQKQLQAEASNNWELSCLPRPWVMPPSDMEMQVKLDNDNKHMLPAITIPENVAAGPRALFPEVYFSVYANQEVESVPPVTNIAASLIRDALLDTINILHYNRNVTARSLIEVDCYFAARTFAARATPFDRLRDIEPPKSTWKPEDVAVDAVFAQLIQLPCPDHKLVYYHSVLTEACKLAPAAIAPSLGRAIRFLYRIIEKLDLELVNRFVDWFSHHLSNFGFTWKWTEWVDDVYLTDLHPRKAFILSAIDKEIRLSFAQRIKNTLPEPYQVLIGPAKELDVPVFKFADDETPFATEGREMAVLLKRKASDEEVQPVIERIHSLALDAQLDPLVTSTDVFVTAVLQVGSKSLSHVLAAIERTKDRLLDAGAASEAARTQIITAVMAFWSAHPGVALVIVEKLLNYSILTPATVIQWALLNRAGALTGAELAVAHMFEMVFHTVVKVSGRVRQVLHKASVAAGDLAAAEAKAAAAPAADSASTSAEASKPGVSVEEVQKMREAVTVLAETRSAEIESMRNLFRIIDDALVAWAGGCKDEMLEQDSEELQRCKLVRVWGTRWLRVFRRRGAIEEAFLVGADLRRIH